MVDHRMGRIKFAGTFDFEGLLKACHKWMNENHFDFVEDLHKHKPPREVHVRFHGENKATGFIKHLIHVSIFCQEFIPVEVVKNGKKKEMIKGRLFIDTTIEIQTDYEGLWTGTPFKQRMKLLLEKFVMKDNMDTLHLDWLYYKALDLTELMKAKLGMELAKDSSVHTRPQSYDVEGGYGK